MKSDVLEKGRIDLMFIESAVNDRVNGTSEQQQRRALEGIVRQAYNANPFTNIVLMAFADEYKLADYKAGEVPAEVRVHHEIAKQYKLPFVNLAKEVNDRINAKEFTWEDDFKNLHPSAFGHEIYFAAIKSLLQQHIVYNEASVNLSPVKVPVAADKFNYSIGHYINIEKAKLIKGFSINPAWNPIDGYKARPGFFNVPVLEGNKPGASFKLSFEGTAVGIAVNSGPDAGMIEYSIDGNSPKTLDLYTSWSKSLHLPWYLILADGLEKKNHVLNVKILDQKNSQSKGHACRVVYFLAN